MKVFENVTNLPSQSLKYKKVTYLVMMQQTVQVVMHNVVHNKVLLENKVVHMTCPSKHTFAEMRVDRHVSCSSS